MNCQDFREMIDSYLCDELMTETNHGVLRHLEQCASCREIAKDRRYFRARLRDAVMNCEEYKICDEFESSLYQTLRQDFMPKGEIKKTPMFGSLQFAFAAAGVLLIAIIGVLFLQNFNKNSTPELASLAPVATSVDFQKIAAGDHKFCAIEHNLEEAPVKIDISQPQFASLKESIINPLNKELVNCEFVGSHSCKYEGQTFTHLVFDYEGKTMSVLMLDLKDQKQLEKNYIAKTSEHGFQVAQFDVDRKAVYVISDLPEIKNSAIANVIEAPVRRRFSDNRQASLAIGTQAAPVFGTRAASLRVF